MQIKTTLFSFLTYQAVKNNESFTIYSVNEAIERQALTHCRWEEEIV